MEDRTVKLTTQQGEANIFRFRHRRKGLCSPESEKTLPRGSLHPLLSFSSKQSNTLAVCIMHKNVVLIAFPLGDLHRYTPSVTVYTCAKKQNTATLVVPTRQTSILDPLAAAINEREALKHMCCCLQERNLQYVMMIYNPIQLQLNITHSCSTVSTEPIICMSDTKMAKVG